MTRISHDPLAHTSLWAMEENFWLEGEDFYRAHLAEDAAMWFPGQKEPRRGAAIVDALRNAPRWEAVAFSDQEMEVDGDRVTLRYTATARRDGQDVYTARCVSTYRRTVAGMLLAEHRQRAV